MVMSSTPYNLFRRPWTRVTKPFVRGRRSSPGAQGGGKRESRGEKTSVLHVCICGPQGERARERPARARARALKLLETELLGHSIALRPASAERATPDACSQSCHATRHGRVFNLEASDASHLFSAV